jgi:uncharacterized protein (UPF0333 family)
MLATRKSQMSVEFMIILVAIILIFTVGILIYMNKVNQVSYMERRAEAHDILHTLAFTINEVHLAGNTSKEIIVIPEKISNEYTYDFEHFPEDHILAIRWDNSYYSFPLITSRVNMSPDINSEVIIENINGVIYVD